MRGSRQRHPLVKRPRTGLAPAAGFLFLLLLALLVTAAAQVPSTAGLIPTAPAAPWTPRNTPLDSPTTQEGIHLLARSGDRERTAPVDPLRPAEFRFGDDPRAGVDLVVTVHAPLTGALGAHGAAPTFTLEARPLRAIPDLEVYLVATGPDGATTALGFGAPTLHASLRLRVDVAARTLTLAHDAAEETAATVAYRAASAGGDALDIRARLEPAPRETSLTFHLDPHAPSLSWRATGPTGLALTLVNRTAGGTLDLQATWRDVPATWSLQGTPGAGAGDWRYRASSPSGPLRVTTTLTTPGEPDAWGRLEAERAPQEVTWTTRALDAPGAFEAAYAASAPIPALHVEGARDGLHATLDVEGVPTHLTLSHHPDAPFQVDTPAPLARVAFTVGDRAACATTPAAAPGGHGENRFRLHETPEGLCASAALHALQGASLHRVPEGGFRFHLQSASDAPLTVDLHGGDGAAGRLRLTPMPRAVTLDLAPTATGARIRYEADQRVALAAAYAPDGRLPDLPSTGLAGGLTLATTAEEGVTLHTLTAPRRLLLNLREPPTTGPTPEGPGDDSGPRTYTLTTATVPDHVDLTLAQGPGITLVAWDSDTDWGETTLDTRAGDGTDALRATLVPLPRRGVLHLTPTSLTYDLADSPGLQLATRTGVAGPLPAAPGEPGAHSVIHPDHATFTLNLPHLPGRGSLQWARGLTLRYEDAVPGAPLPVVMEGSGTRTTLELPLPERLEFHLHAPGPRALEVRWRIPAPIPTLDMRVEGPGAARGGLSLADLPLEGRLLLDTPLAAALPGVPHLEYDAASAGLSLTLHTDGGLAGLGPGGTLHVPTMPARATLRHEGATLRLHASAPLTLQATTGPTRWGGPHLGFDTRDVTLRLDGVTGLALTPGLLGLTVSGDSEGRVEVTHLPAAATGNLLLLTVGPDGHAFTANEVNLDLAALQGAPVTVYYAQNVHTLAAAVSPGIAMAALLAVATCAGLLLVPRRGLRALG